MRTKIQVKKADKQYLITVDGIRIGVTRSELKRLRNAISKALMKNDPNLIFGRRK